MSIKQLREAADMKQYELAARMGVSAASVSAWETGQAYCITKEEGLPCRETTRFAIKQPGKRPV